MTSLYGVDLDAPLTALIVRDALIECFYQAHCLDTDLGLDRQPSTKTYCLALVQKAFSESGGDFEQPDKKSLLRAMEELKKFAANFRDPQIIAKHAAEIMQLINKLA